MEALREHQAAWVELWLVHGEAGGNASRARPRMAQDAVSGRAFGSLVITLANALGASHRGNV